jgi:thiamine-phosphate diphosphorylase
MLSMKKYSIGLYPIIDSAQWLDILLPLGIEHIQLRIKDKTGVDLETEIKKSILRAQKYKAKLYINDYWELAVRYGAYGVHLGQEDFDMASMGSIVSAGLKVGISAYNDEELARALKCHPTYIAFGPIFPTSSKLMSVTEQGIEKLAEWRRKVTCPLVAIGGINQENIGAVLDAGVDGVALISAITKAADPVSATKELLGLLLR